MSQLLLEHIIPPRTPPTPKHAAVGQLPLCARVWREYAQFESLHSKEPAGAVEGILRAAQGRGVLLDGMLPADGVYGGTSPGGGGGSLVSLDIPR